MQPRVMAFAGYNDKSEYIAQKKKILFLNQSEIFPDIICDVSTCFSQNHLWKIVVQETGFIAAAVPIYHTAACNTNISAASILSDFYDYAEGGVKIITIHPTPDERLIALSRSRDIPVTSRGGKIVIKSCLSQSWLGNVYADILDEIIHIALEYNITVSIGTTFRASNIFDSLDSVNIEEIKKQIYIANYIKNFGVNTILEGPGHIHLNKINDYAKLIKPSGIKIMPLGPIVCEYEIGNEHVSAAIGATALGMALDIENIAIVTPAEHSGGIPSVEDTLIAIKSAKMAAHIINLNKNNIDKIDKYNVSLRIKNKSCMNSGKCYRCGKFCPLDD